MAKRIGVYVCHCGGNISDVVDVEKVVEAVKDYPGVVVAKHFMFMCADAGQKMIEDDIKNYNLDGVVVASCSPKLHEATFRNCVARAGLNPYQFYHVNIREDASWAHSDNVEEATRKAISHVKAGIEYVRYSKPLEKIKVKTTPSVLVIGGGVAGIRVALDLSKMGVSVFLVEKSPFLGGRVSQIWRTFPEGESGKDIVKRLIAELKKRDNIAVYTNAEIESFSGFLGNFTVKIKVSPRHIVKKNPKMMEAIEKCPVEVPNEFDYGLTKRKVIYIPYEGAYPELPVIDMEHCTKCGECAKILGDAVDFDQQPQTVTLNVGAVIVATGFDPYEPKEGEFGYKQFSNVVTLPQLERILDMNNGEKLIFNGREIKSIAFIYCVGSRQIPTGEGKVNEYCSRYCCTAATHLNAELLKKFNDLVIYNVYRDIRTYGKHELNYYNAGKTGAVFIRYDPYDPPKVQEQNGKLIVSVKDLLTNKEEIEIPVDMVVLVTGMTARENKKLEEIMKIPVGRDRFYQEIHPKLRPVETNVAGILIAGTCQGPKNISETLASASAAAAKAATIVLKETIELEPSVAFVDPNKCDLRKLCMAECPVGAITEKEYEGKGVKAWVNEALCLGCGACVAVCPTEAIQLKTLTTEQIRAMIKAMAEG